MATKGQKQKKYSIEFRNQILKEYKEGYGVSALANLHPEVSNKTIENWIWKHNRGIDITIDHRKGKSGHPKTKNLTLEDYKERYEILKKYRAFLEVRHTKK